MSTRYVWDKYNIAYGDKQITSTTSYVVSLSSGSYDGAFYFATGIQEAANGTYNLTGTVVNAVNMSTPSSKDHGYLAANTYRYAARNRTGNTIYLEYTDVSEAAWCFQVSSSGGYVYSGTVVLRYDGTTFGPQYSFNKYQVSMIKGQTKIGAVSSNSSNAYPNDGVSGSNWYELKGTDSVDPISVTYDTDKPEPGKDVKIIVTPNETQTGLHWNPATLPKNATWSNVINFNGTFFAFGAYWDDSAGIDEYYVAKSVNGENWALVSGSNYPGAVSLACSNTRIVGLKGNSIIYSTDGVNWTGKTLSVSDKTSISGVIGYCNDKFIILVNKSKYFLYSTDGINWTEKEAFPNNRYWNCVVFGGGTYIAASNEIWYSSDGVEWVYVSPNNSTGLSSNIIAYGNNKFLSVGTKLGLLAVVESSDGGATWETIYNFSFSSNIINISFGDGKFVISARDNETEEWHSFYSTYGTEWKEFSFPSDEEWDTLSFCDSNFISTTTYKIDNNNNVVFNNKAAYTTTSGLGGTISYQYQYSTNGGTTWINAGTPTTDLEKSITVPNNAEHFMARVKAQDDMGFVSNDYVTGANLEVQLMKLWVGIENNAHAGKKLWVGVDNKARRVVRAWVGVDGKARRFF